MQSVARRVALAMALVAGNLACGGGEAERRSGSDAVVDQVEQAAADADAADPGRDVVDEAGSAADGAGDVAGDLDGSTDDAPVAATCPSETACAAEFDCGPGERCNLTLAPARCQTLYCAGVGEPCDPAAGDALCRPGLFCVPRNPPVCATCKPACDGRACGDDGCGGSCGACADSDECSPEGACVLHLAWIALPAGVYLMGSNDGDTDEQPVHTVTLSTFDMAKTETTQAQYQACLDAGACTAPSCDWAPDIRADFPVACVDWAQSKRFCDWVGGRLCTEAEWEYAARSGGDAQEYPWGDAAPTCELAVMNDGLTGEGCGTGAAMATCSKPAGNSAQGLCDLAGNVWEWTADWYGPYPSGAQTNPTGPATGEGPVTRGGCWYFPAPTSLRASTRAGYYPDGAGENLGLRCCRSH